MALPIHTVSRPSTLAGLANGQLPSSALDYIGVGSARMEKTAARAFRAMFAAARRELGVEIKHVGDYRSFQAQLNLFLSRYKPVTYVLYSATPTRHRKYWAAAKQHGYSSQYWIKKSTGYATAASPGSSNHGWGLALDIAEEYDSDSAADPITQRFVNWLVANAHKYGVSAELQSEPWHWRYFAGDAIPLAVRQHEQGTTPPPPPPTTPPPTGGKITVQFTTEVARLGSTGPHVKRIQQILNEVAGQGVTVDGNFGPQTEQAVKNWQAFFNSPPVDGIVGAKTWQSLIEIWLMVK